MKLTDRQTELLDKVYADVKKRKRFPQLRELPFTRNTLRYHFGNMLSLESAYQQKYDLPPIPTKDRWARSGASILMPETSKKKKKEIEWEKKWAKSHKEITEFESYEFNRKSKRFIIATALVGDFTTDAIVKTLNRASAQLDAQVLLIPCAHPVGRRSPNGKGFFDKRLAQFPLVHDDLHLNTNLHISGLRLQAQMRDPSTSTMELIQHGGSMIAGHPQQRLRIGADLKETSRAFFTPGAVTLPDYQTDRYESERTSYIAQQTHIVGALMVEITNDSLFHARHVAFNKKGEFVDMGVKYSPDSHKPWEPFIIKPGDLHAGETDPVALDALDKLVAHIGKPAHITCDDIFDCRFWNHHDKDKHLTRTLNKNRSLREELEQVRTLMFRLRKLCRKGLVVCQSNHDRGLDKYYEADAYCRDYANKELAIEILNKLFKTRDPIPLRVALRVTGKLPDKTRWLREGESFKFWNIEHGQHGHKGPNGTRGRVKALRDALGPCSLNHFHGVEILGWARTAGTFTKTGTHTRPKYAQGDPSNWTQGVNITYKQGFRQTLICVDGSFGT